MILGVTAAFAWILLAAGPERPGRTELIDAMLAGLAAGLLTARLGYVLLHMSTFAGRPEESLAIWQGGLSGWAGVAGALIGVRVFASAARLPFWRLADRLAVPAALIAFSTWIGCLGDGCAYGRMAAGSRLALSGPDWTGVVRQRWPAQAIGALSAVAAIGCTYLARNRPWPGLPVSATLTVLAAGGVAVSLLRADPAPAVAGLRYDLLGNGLLLLSGLGLSLWRFTTREDQT